MTIVFVHFIKQREINVPVREVVYMVRPIEPNEGPSGADVLCVRLKIGTRVPY
jgi:hypothetical protein